MYKIHNISGYYTVAGLYPGNTKIISELSQELVKLEREGLIFIEKCDEQKQTKSKKDVIKNDNKEKQEDIKSEVE